MRRCITAARRWSSVSRTAIRATAKRSSRSSTANTPATAARTSARSAKGLLKAVNEYCGGKYEGDDVREAMVGAVAIRLKDPMFESQTKNKLGNTEIRTELVNNVREELLHFLPIATSRSPRRSWRR
jgi:hypothetical protein